MICGILECRCTPHGDGRHCICLLTQARSVCCYCEERCIRAEKEETTYQQETDDQGTATR